MFLFDIDKYRGVADANPVLVEKDAVVTVREGDNPLLFITDINNSNQQEVYSLLHPLFSSFPHHGLVHLSLPLFCGGKWDRSFASNIQAAVLEQNPSFVICLGTDALVSIFPEAGFQGLSASKCAGACIPFEDTFVISTYGVEETVDVAVNTLIKSHLQLATKPHKRTPGPVIVLNDTILDKLETDKYYAFDYETSGLKPYDDGHFIYSMSIAEVDSKEAYSFLVTEQNTPKIKQFLSNRAYKKIAHNLKMEDKWSRVILDTPVRGWVWDTCLGAHCINSAQPSGLKFQAFLHFGVVNYSTTVDSYITSPTSNTKNDIRNAPLKPLLTYGALDAYYTACLYIRQKRILESWENVLPHSESYTYGVEFFSRVQQAFSVMESNGLGFDLAKMHKNSLHIARERQDAEMEFSKTDLCKTWEKTYRAKTDFNSPSQLSNILFNVLQHTPPKLTDKGAKATDADTLLELGIPDLEPFIRAKKYDKTSGTYYTQFDREVSDKNTMHCEMLLNRVRTFRTSCSNPNLQNITNRDKDQSKLIRELFIPHDKDWCLVEADLKGCEVSGAACHTLDKNLIAYVSDSSLDMHRDIATKIFRIPVEQVSKSIRTITKSYTFGSFYGSFWKLTGPHLWKQIKAQNPTLVDGTPVFAHLASHGLKTEAAFTESVQDADNHFWKVQFPEYNNWKDTTYAAYQKNGYVDMFTGFRRWGPMSRNQVINTPIQGDSSHINLWLCLYVLAQINSRKLLAKPALQIHDSVVGTVHKDHLVEYCTLFQEGIELLKTRWKWMICPFSMEFEVAEPGKSWYDKKEFSLTN